MRPPILITGCPRSGTSLVAGIVERCGAQGGKTCGPTAANRRGQYENEALRNAVTKPFLRALEVDPLGQDPLPDILLVSLNATNSRTWSSMRAKVLSTMKGQGVDLDEPWYVKEPKLCLIWPLWDMMFPEAAWLVVRRDDDEIAESCLRTNFMRRYKNKVGWQPWIDHHKLRMEEIECECSSFEVWSKHIVRGDMIEISAAIEWAGLTWDQNAVNEFVAPQLYHTQEVFDGQCQ